MQMAVILPDRLTKKAVLFRNCLTKIPNFLKIKKAIWWKSGIPEFCTQVSDITSVPMDINYDKGDIL